MLKPGDRAPEFKLLGDDGEAHTLKELGRDKLILYFYPRDATPGCTVEACELRDHRVAIGKRGARIVGVSPDSVATHQKWQGKERFGFLLLSDPEHAAAEAYGAWGEKTLYGRKFMGIIRSTFVIERGHVVSAQYKVSPKGHAAALLAQLAGGAPAAATKPTKPAKPAKKPTKQARA